VLYRIGKKEHMKMMAIGSISLMPIQSMKSGNQPRAGIGYNKLKMGLKAVSTSRFHPIMIPRVIPAAVPAKSPAKIRIRLARKFSARTPVCVKNQNSWIVAEKGGRRLS
jgi:hypothetical protein